MRCSVGHGESTQVALVELVRRQVLSALQLQHLQLIVFVAVSLKIDSATLQAQRIDVDILSQEILSYNFPLHGLLVVHVTASVS